MDHSTTKELLEEERVRYERCRANLETSQQHLANLNEQFNELRAEVEVRLSYEILASPPPNALRFARTQTITRRLQIWASTKSSISQLR